MNLLLGSQSSSSLSKESTVSGGRMETTLRTMRASLRKAVAMEHTYSMMWTWQLTRAMCVGNSFRRKPVRISVGREKNEE